MLGQFVTQTWTNAVSIISFTVDRKWPLKDVNTLTPWNLWIFYFIWQKDLTAVIRLKALGGGNYPGFSGCALITWVFKLENFPRLRLESEEDVTKRKWSQCYNIAGFEDGQVGPGAKAAGNGFSFRASRKECTLANIFILGQWDPEV